MKGIIFNLLEDVVSRNYGEVVWDEFLDDAGLDGAYTSLGSYSDDEFEALLTAAAALREISRDEALRWFGRAAMPLLAERYPAFFDAHRTLLPFVFSVNDIIHPEVRKIHPGAHCPVFHFEHGRDGALLLGYQSDRRLCALAQGFVEGAADHFGETAVVEHIRCTAAGDPECQLSIRVQGQVDASGSA